MLVLPLVTSRSKTKKPLPLYFDLVLGNTFACVSVSVCVFFSCVLTDWHESKDIIPKKDVPMVVFVGVKDKGVKRLEW